MNLINNFTFAVILLLLAGESICYREINDTLEEKNSPVLSRRKRFLAFPEGSSFQLVFCVQTSALILIGDIFLYGSTAALAWSLPTDPKYLHLYKDKEDAQRRGDVRHHIYYLDEKGKLIAKVPFHRKKIANPAIAKRSVDENETTFKEKLKLKIDRMRMHEKQKDRDYLKKHHLDQDSVEFHRSSRVGLYKKLEALITALGGDGRQCVLHKLCESAQVARQGTFQYELLRVLFTLPKGKEFELEEHREYDIAHSEADDCAVLYPGCEDFEMPVNI